MNNTPAIPSNKDQDLLLEKLEKLLKDIIQAKSKGKITILIEYLPKNDHARVEINSHIQKSQNLIFQSFSKSS